MSFTGNIRQWFHRIQGSWNVAYFEWGEGGGYSTITVYLIFTSKGSSSVTSKIILDSILFVIFQW